MQEQTRTQRLYEEARAAVQNDDRITPFDKDRLLYLPPLYLIQWCKMAGKLEVRDD